MIFGQPYTTQVAWQNVFSVLLFSVKLWGHSHSYPSTWGSVPCPLGTDAHDISACIQCIECCHREAAAEATPTPQRGDYELTKSNTRRDIATATSRWRNRTPPSKIEQPVDENRIPRLPSYAEPFTPYPASVRGLHGAECSALFQLSRWQLPRPVMQSLPVLLAKQTRRWPGVNEV